MCFSSPELFVDFENWPMSRKKTCIQRQEGNFMLTIDGLHEIMCTVPLYDEPPYLHGDASRIWVYDCVQELFRTVHVNRVTSLSPIANYSPLI